VSSEPSSDGRRRFALLQVVAIVAVTTAIGAAGAAGVRAAEDDTTSAPDAEVALSSHHSPGATAADRRAHR
jgi:hypothetical protein